MKKKIYCLLLVGMLTLSTACGKSTPSESSSVESSTLQNESAEKTPSFSTESSSNSTDVINTSEQVLQETQIQTTEQQSQETESASATNKSNKNTNKDLILFRNMQWYDTKVNIDAVNEMKEETYNTYNDIYRLTGIDFSNVCSGKDHVENGGLKVRYSNSNVAGYTPSDTYMCYIYPIQNKKIIRDDNAAEFYFGWYTFKHSDFSDIPGLYTDLESKLTLLYGNGKSDKDDYHSWIIWKDSEGNQVRILKDDEETYITLGYIASGADKRIDEMQSAVEAEKVEAEKQLRNENSNNSDGL